MAEFKGVCIPKEENCRPVTGGLSSSSNIHERQDKCKAVRQAIRAVSNAIKY